MLQPSALVELRFFDGGSERGGKRARDGKKGVRD